MKIASILPYKENYSKKGAGAVALWISEFMRDSIYKNKTYVIGNTLNKKYLTKNYINININNIIDIKIFYPKIIIFIFIIKRVICSWKF